ncbi:MAG: mechanosensitive ion channel family protein [Verrucomicrobiota bacterium]|nr:mechanosensitive ion channel family protein [Verrucomicrobiota bacterium]
MKKSLILTVIVLLLFNFMNICYSQETPLNESTQVETEQVNNALTLTHFGKEVTASTEDFLCDLLGEWIRGTIFGIHYWRYFVLFSVIFFTFLVSAMARHILHYYGQKLVSKTKTEFDDRLIKNAKKPLGVAIQSLGFYFAFLPMLPFFTPLIGEYIGRVAIAIAVAALFWYIYDLIELIDVYLNKWSQKTNTDLDDTFVNIIRKTLRMVLVILGTLFIGQTILNLKVTALLASVGIAGMAIAFAAQDTIANFFGSFMIALDKPFQSGDRIKIGGFDGIIEAVGIRSTKIRTLSGHLITVPNKTVADSMVENISKRPYIKRVINIGVTYDTPIEKVQKGVKIIKDILDNHQGMDEEFPPQVYFSEFKDCSLNIVAYAWFHPPQWWDYLAWSEKVNFKIMRQFEDEGIEFAFPTTTTYLAHDENRPITIKTEIVEKKEKK